MKSFDRWLSSEKISLPLPGEVIMGIKLSAERNFSRLKFVRAEKKEALTDMSSGLISFLKNKCALKSGFSAAYGLSDLHLSVLREKFLLPVLSSSGAEGFLKTENLFFAMNFSQHLEVSSFLSTPEKAFESLDQILSVCEKIESFSNIAFLPEFGFLCDEPVRSGNMLSLKVIVHLPGFKKSGRFPELLKEAKIFRINFSSLSGDLPETGSFYLLEARGGVMKEEEFIKKSLLYLEGLSSREMELRKKLSFSPETEDSFFRALGILKYCRKLGFFESVSLLSELKLGCNLGFLPGKYDDRMASALSSFQPATVRWLKGKEKISDDIFRARLSRALFSNL
ncbi:MAG: protein arginine kinase [Elusimicrobiota bacterium]